MTGPFMPRIPHDFDSIVRGQWYILKFFSQLFTVTKFAQSIHDCGKCHLFNSHSMNSKRFFFTKTAPETEMDYWYASTGNILFVCHRLFLACKCVQIRAL